MDSQFTIDGVGSFGGFIGGIAGRNIASTTGYTKVYNSSFSGRLDANSATMGGIFGQMNGGQIQNTTVSGSINTLGNFVNTAVGGIVGYMLGGTIGTANQEVVFSGTAKGTNHTGGIVGRVYGSEGRITIRQVASRGLVDGMAGKAAGLVADLSFDEAYPNSVHISEAAVTGTIQAGSAGGTAGGAFGAVRNIGSTSASPLTIQYVYSQAAVTGRLRAAGFINILINSTASGAYTTIQEVYVSGTVNPGNVAYPFTYRNDSYAISRYQTCYWDSQVFWSSASIGDQAGAIGKTTAQLQTAPIDPAWSSSVWTFSTGAYPKLRWEP